MRRRLLVQNAFRFDRSQWRPVEALRCTLGLALPLLIAVLLGHPSWGVLAATGALNTGLASYSGVTRARLRLMLTTTTVTAAVTVLGVLVGQNSWLGALAVLVAGVLLAIYGASGPAATTISLQAVTVLIVLTGLHLPLSQALPSGALVLLGGLLQTLLLAAVWPLAPRWPERRVVASVYRSLARFTEQLPTSPDHLLPDALPLQTAWALLDEANTYRWRTEHAELRQRLHRAEALRGAITGLAVADAEFRQVGEPERVQAQTYADALARTLRQSMDDIRHGHNAPADLEALRAALDVLPGSTTSLPSQRYRHWAELVYATLNAPARARPEQPIPAQNPAAPTEQPQTRQGWWSRVLRLPLGPLVLRHALRYGLALGLSTLLYRLLNIQHGYWLPLTVAVLLRQDYAATLTRGLARLTGTLGGVLLATLLVLLVHPSAAVLSGLSLGAAFLVYALFLTNYAVFSAAITVYVVCSVAASGLAEEQVGLLRIVATLLGGLTALGVSLLWPSWQSGSVWKTLQDAVQAQASYAGAVDALVQATPETFPRTLLEADRAGRHARALRLQAEGTLQAAALEPGRRRAEQRRVLFALLSRLHANAAQVLTLHAEAEALHTTHRRTRTQAAQHSAALREQIMQDVRALQADTDSLVGRATATDETATL
ncbi:FUSC family protein [Deinococcus ruber]|uniref:FUSC family protein n=1 Tax=Deinococcus ruber TaxID=1848197 RepID=UPI00166ACF71|nr:FUSC family protein [Deinococcus ruber]